MELRDYVFGDMMNVHKEEREGRLVLDVKLPGEIRKEDLKVSFEEGVLHIEYSSEKQKKGEEYKEWRSQKGNMRYAVPEKVGGPIDCSLEKGGDLKILMSKCEKEGGGFSGEIEVKSSLPALNDDEKQ